METKPAFYRVLSAFVCFSACGGLSHAGDGAKAEAAAVPYDLGKETYKTQLLFSYDGGAQNLYGGDADKFLLAYSAGPKVYKNNVYLPLVAHGRSLRIIKVPLNGGDAQIEPVQEGYRLNDDSHQYVTVNVDAKGYIHVTGGFHTAKVVQHWVSVKPEDISEFRRTEGTQSPAGTNVTYPNVTRSPDGTLYCSLRIGRPTDGGHAGGLSSLDADSQTWTMIGADIPKAMGGVVGRPVTVWEDNGEAPGIGYNRTGVRFTFDRNNRMHLCFGVLNKTPEALSKESAHVLSDILYAWSDDGGKTIFKSDGSPIQWPVRAEAGPNQAEVVWAGSANQKDPWLVYGHAIHTDWQNRPIIQFQSTRTGLHTLRLKDGKWVDCKPVLDIIGRGGSVCRDNTGVLLLKEAQTRGRNLVRAWDSDHTRIMDLELPAKWQIQGIDDDHLRDTGELIFTVLSTKSPGTVGIMRTVITKPCEEAKTTSDFGAAHQKTPEAMEPDHAETPRVKAWRDLHYGLFLHWNMNTFVKKETDFPSPPQYAPTTIDVDQWVRAARDAGMKYAVLTAKHNFGFCLWDSKVSWQGKEFDFDVAASGNTTDVVRLFLDTCKKHQIVPGLYYNFRDSHANRVDGGKGLMQADYFELVKAHLRELTTRYPDCHYYWMDRSSCANAEQFAAVYELLRRANPQNIVLFNAHIARPWGTKLPPGFKPLPAGSGERSDLIERIEGFGFPTDIVNTEGNIRAALNPVAKFQNWQGRKYHVGYEHCARTGDGWGWFNNQGKPYPAQELFTMYQSVRRNGGNLLLNVGPTQSGQIDGEYVKTLMELKTMIEPFEEQLAKGDKEQR